MGGARRRPQQRMAPADGTDHAEQPRVFRHRGRHGGDACRGDARRGDACRGERGGAPVGQKRPAFGGVRRSRRSELSPACRRAPPARPDAPTTARRRLRYMVRARPSPGGVHGEAGGVQQGEGRRGRLPTDEIRARGWCARAGAAPGRVSNVRAGGQGRRRRLARRLFTHTRCAGRRRRAPAPSRATRTCRTTPPGDPAGSRCWCGAQSRGSRA